MCADIFLGADKSNDPEVLTEKIRQLIDKNQVKGSELSLLMAFGIEYDLTLTVEWDFVGVCQKTIKAGNHKTDIHFGYDNLGFDKHQHNLMQEAQHGTRLRTPFIHKLASLDKHAPLQYHQKHTFHRYEPFSKTHDCDDCRAMGEVMCRDCQGKGKKHCWACGGSGDESYQVPMYDNKGAVRGYQTHYRSCLSCLGSGYNKCRPCDGRGKITCQACRGEGVFTHIVEVSAQAEPCHSVSIKGDGLDDLRRFLNQKGMDFCAKMLDLTLISHREVKSDRHHFVYTATDEACELVLMLRGVEYECQAFSKSLYPYVRPAIFDDLFAEEWQFLQNAFDKQGNIKKAKAQLFFHQYLEQPALDKALKDIAQKHNPQLSVFHACQGFISYQMAQNIGHGLVHVLKGVSPQYFPCAWFVGGIPAIILVFIIAEYHLQEAMNVIEVVISLCVALFYALVFVLLFGVLSWAMSRLYVYGVNQKIPQAYRLPASNKLPLRYYLMATIVAFVVGVSYGLLAGHGKLPVISPEVYLTVMKVKQVMFK